MDLDLGTPLSSSATRLLLLGAGELGREVAIEAMRLGVEVIACDRYRDAPAMQVAHRSHVFDMQDREAVRAVVLREKPQYIVPEVEAIATDALVELETEGWTVIPTAQAARLTMDREGIRRLAAETLGLPTSRYAFADTLEQVEAAVREIGLPCVIKPVMSSSGKGQSTVKDLADVAAAWDYALVGARGRSARVIVEGFVKFDSEITLLTVRTRHEGTLFCPPIGHRQERGDYMESWQPHAMSPDALARAQAIAEQVTAALGGYGLFGVELFVVGEEMVFSEVSPRPHDTGMVTMATQDLSEFELHVRAILGLPIGQVILRAPGASAVILAERAGHNPRFVGLSKALRDPRVKVRLFGKPDTRRYRRMGVVITYGDSVDDARERARAAAAFIEVVVDAG
jgi:phosphoribosylglycinamide formyltransferase 2